MSGRAKVMMATCVAVVILVACWLVGTGPRYSIKQPATPDWVAPQVTVSAPMPMIDAGTPIQELAGSVLDEHMRQLDRCMELVRSYEKLVQERCVMKRKR